MVGRSVIEIRESGDANRIDAATLPPFRNETRCARCRRLWGVRAPSWEDACAHCEDSSPACSLRHGK